MLPLEENEFVNFAQGVTTLDGVAMEPPVIAAIITGCVTVVGFVLQGWFFAARLEKLRQGGAARTLRLQKQLERIATLQGNRATALQRLYKAASTALEAASTMVGGSGTKDAKVLIPRITEFLQKISSFLDEAKQAPSNLELTPGDVTQIDAIQTALSEFFVALDMGSGDNPTYQKELRTCVEILRDNVRALELSIRAEIQAIPYRAMSRRERR